MSHTGSLINKTIQSSNYLGINNWILWFGVKFNTNRAEQKKIVINFMKYS